MYTKLGMMRMKNQIPEMNLRNQFHFGNPKLITAQPKTIPLKLYVRVSLDYLHQLICSFEPPRGP